MNPGSSEEKIALIKNLNEADLDPATGESCKHHTFIIDL